MPHTRVGVSVAATWLAIASFLMIATLILHGPIAADHAEQMQRIANAGRRWQVAHWIAAAGLSLYAVAGLVVLSSGSRLTNGWWTTTAWAVLPVSAMWTTTTAIAEATVVSSAVASGTMDTYAAWWAFSEGKANGFAFLALAMAVIARNEMRAADRSTPAWSARVGMTASIASFTGWALGMWFGVRLGNIVWVVASIVMSLWTLWFGSALWRSTRG